MGEWRRVRVGDFLSERKGRYKPGDDAIDGLQRVDKIDFSGNIHLSFKDSKTDLITICPGDLLISGINVAKGAIAVYHGEHSVVATIHYSSYTFDEQLVSIEYFRRFVRSPLFGQILKDQVRGGIKTEIKSKDFLPLRISLPDLATQNKIVERFQGIEEEISDIACEAGNQASLIKQLRQAVLQEAVEGKLTADWRKRNLPPFQGEGRGGDGVKGDPNYDAAALLAQIKAEKELLVKAGKIRKEKPLAPIDESDKPFELPAGWVWCLGEQIGEYIDPQPSHRTPPEVQSGIPYISMKNTDLKGNIYFETARKVSSAILGEHLDRYKISSGDFFIGKIGTIGNPVWLPLPQNYTLSANTVLIKPNQTIIDPKYMFSVLKSDYCLKHMSEVSSEMSYPVFGIKKMRLMPFPLPPLAEQQAIVARVDSLMSMIDELEQQVAERKGQAQMLMQAVLREAFAGGEGAEAPDFLPLQGGGKEGDGPEGRPLRENPILTTALKGRGRSGFRKQGEGADLPLVAEPSVAYNAGGQAALSAANQPVPGGIPTRILAAMHACREYSRADLLAATGITEADWIWAIRQLKEQGRVVQKGEKRGARYVRK